KGPVFIFMPRQGGKGSQLHLTGANFTPGSILVIRIGVPDPVGDPLTTANVNEKGSWNASFIMPGTLPNGQAITGDTVNIVVMDENNNIIGTQPFRYRPTQ